MSSAASEPATRGGRDVSGGRVAPHRSNAGARCKTLPRADKLRFVQFLVIDLAQEEGVPLVAADSELPVWTPLDASDAAEALLKML